MDTKEYRQVVSDKSITSSKSFNDYLYGWLVLKAQEENGERFVMKRSFVFSKMEKELGMTRKTLTKQFNNLIELGLVADGNDKWILTDLGSEGFGISVDILNRLVALKTKHVISLYVYLKKGYWVVHKTNYVVLLNNIKTYLGFTDSTRSNNKFITGLFEQLRVIGLLKYELKYDVQTKKSFYMLYGLEKENYF